MACFREDLPESAYKFQLLGLNLLRLLAQNKLSDFHTVSSLLILGFLPILPSIIMFMLLL